MAIEFDAKLAVVSGRGVPARILRAALAGSGVVAAGGRAALVEAAATACRHDGGGNCRFALVLLR